MKKAQRPAQGLSYEGGRPRDEDSLTRKRLPLWDRIKWLVLLAALWLILVWRTTRSSASSTPCGSK
jgi:cell division protease FtsH